MIFYHVLSETIAYQAKPLDFNNPLIYSQYLENLICQVLVLQSIGRGRTDRLAALLTMKGNCVTMNAQ